MENCLKLGITEDDLKNKTIRINILQKELNFGLLVEFYNFLKLENLAIQNYFCHWISNLCNIDIISINENALISKFHRQYKLLKNKRGLARLEILNQQFLLPLQTCSTPKRKPCKQIDPNIELVSDLQQSFCQQEIKLKTVNFKLSDRREKVKQISEKNKQLKRKLDRSFNREDEKSTKIQKYELEINSLKRELKKKTTETTLLKNILDNAKKKSTKYTNLYYESKRTEIKLNKELKSTSIEISNAKSALQEKETELNKDRKLNEELKECHTSIEYLESLLQDTPELILYDEDLKKFNTKTIECVINLSDLKVPIEKISPVIKQIADICGKIPNNLPSTRTIERMIDSKIAIAHKQISNVLSNKIDTTLYTDETRKYGKTLQTYIVTDDNKTSYVLGLREMLDKSSKSCLDTFKEILKDITDHCYEQEKDNEKQAGYELLCHLKNTMSDRASTEKAFNVLLENFRREILPLIIEDWNKLDVTEQALCSKMNNFFCGLHLMVGIADVCEKALYKFEEAFLEGKDIGSAHYPELKRFHRHESGTLRLIRTACKVFAVGEDEKSGASMAWMTFLKQQGEKNLFIRFKHNRFNLVFVLGLACYFHKTLASIFLDTVHGTNNGLLRAVSLDIKEDLYLAGCKSFGLISKLITGPLWRLLESPGHILEMNKFYKQVIDFLVKGVSDTELAVKFCNGTESPFDTDISTDDKLLQDLVKENTDVDAIVVPMVQNLFQAIHELLSRLIIDHLPGGTFWEPEEYTLLSSKSALKHNRLPEFVFGQLDQLLRYRPNATVLTNESFIMYSHNKTRHWLASLDEIEKKKLITESMKEGKEQRQLFRSRLADIQIQRIEVQKQKQQQLQELERKRIQKAEDMTNMVCYYGLWQNQNQVEEGLSVLKSEKEKRAALEAQLKFRKTVLKQKHPDKKIYNFSKLNERGKYTKLTIQQLKDNVETLIKDTLKEPTHENATQGRPLLVGKTIKHSFSDGNIYDGYVISMVPGFSMWYNIKYERDDAIYAFNLVDDMEKGDLSIVVANQ